MNNKKNIKYYEIVLKDGRIFGKIKPDIGKKILDYMELPKAQIPFFIRIDENTGFAPNMISSINPDRENWQYDI